MPLWGSVRKMRIYNKYIFWMKLLPILIVNRKKLVQEALDKFMHGRITLVIAHRLSTAKTCRQLIILEDGNVTGMGTHMELSSITIVAKKLFIISPLKQKHYHLELSLLLRDHLKN